MKTLKFKPELCEQILRGEKTATWRLFDDKALASGDQIELMNDKTLLVFGNGIITTVTIKTLGTLEESDWEGHERYSSDEEMYAIYRSYYGDKVNPETEIKIIDFSFTPLGKEKSEQYSTE